MKALLCVDLSLFVCSYSYSYTQAIIRLEDTSKHIDDSVTVCSKMSGGHFLDTAKNTPKFLNLGHTFPNHTPTIIIWNEVRKPF